MAQVLSIGSRFVSASAAESVKAAVTAAATKVKAFAVQAFATISLYATIAFNLAKQYAAKGLTSVTTFVANNPVVLKTAGLVGLGAAAGALAMKFFTPKRVAESDIAVVTRIHATHDTTGAAANAKATAVAAAARALIDAMNA